MPFARDSLTELRAQVSEDIAAALPGSNPLLRFSNLGIIGAVQASMTYLMYGYLDYIAQQSVPFTATEEYLEGWAALKNVYRITAAPAQGTAQFTGTNGVSIPSGTPIVRADGQQYRTTASGTIASGSVTVPATAVPDPEGLVGAIGNCDAGTALTLGTAIAGVTSTGVAATAFIDGTDLEKDDALRARMLLTYQNPPHGGDQEDYVEWALAIPGVTRAWCVPNAFGSGTVAVYVMMDIAEAAHGGFPQGTNGVSQNDHGPNAGAPRDTVATGDQLTVADAICLVQPVTALVYVLAPIAQAVNFVISGISGASAATKSAVSAAIASVLAEFATIGAGTSTLNLNYIESAIDTVPGTAGFVIVSPAGNIATPSGNLPVLGTITYT